MKTAHDFTTGPILSPLVRFVFPVLLALLLQSLYGAVDLLVVGRYGEAANVSAVSIGAMVMQTLTFVITDIAMGATILIGRKIGEKKEGEIGKIIASDLLLFLLMAIVMTALVEPLAGLVAKALQAPSEAYEGTVSYIRICTWGSACIVAYNVLGSIFRGLGNSMMPLISVAIACVCNIFGDLYFVAVLGMAERGAAIATVLSQALSVVISVLVIRKQSFSFHIARKDIRWDKTVIKDTVRLGLPIALQDLLVSISFLFIAAIVNRLGLIASAGVGIAEKVCGFLMLVPSSFMQAMSAFTAQNVGAGRTERADRSLLYGILLSLCVGLLMFYLAFFHGTALSLVFTTDREVASAAADYLKAYAIDCILTSFLFCLMGYFNGIGRTTFVMVQGIIGAFLIRIPVSLLMSKEVPVSLFHVGLATPCSSVVQIVLCISFFLLLKKRRKR